MNESPPKQVPAGSWVRRVWAVPEVGILLPLVAFTLFFYVLNRSFLSPKNIGAMLRSVSFVGVIAVGQTLLLIAGELDLSVGSVAGLCAIVASWLMKHESWPVGPAVLAGLLYCGAGIGIAVLRRALPSLMSGAPEVALAR